MVKEVGVVVKEVGVVGKELMEDLQNHFLIQQ